MSLPPSVFLPPSFSPLILLALSLPLIPPSISFFLPIVSVYLSEEVQTTLVSLWKSHKYTDVTFVINGHPVPAHKAILASQSEYFGRMLFGELREASMNEITLQEVSLEVFEKVLQYAYSGVLRMKEHTLQVSNVLFPVKLLHA